MIAQINNDSVIIYSVFIDDYEIQALSIGDDSEFRVM